MSGDIFLSSVWKLWPSVWESLFWYHGTWKTRKFISESRIVAREVKKISSRLWTWLVKYSFPHARGHKLMALVARSDVLHGSGAGWTCLGSSLDVRKEKSSPRSCNRDGMATVELSFSSDSKASVFHSTPPPLPLPILFWKGDNNRPQLGSANQTNVYSVPLKPSLCDLQNVYQEQSLKLANLRQVYLSVKLNWME